MEQHKESQEHVHQAADGGQGFAASEDAARPVAGAASTEQETPLPCPFCGDAPTENAIAPHTHRMTIDGWPVMPDHAGSHVIECACGAGMLADTREAVLAMWNRRPARNVTQKEDAFLRNAAKECSTLVAPGRLIGIGDDEAMERVSATVGVHGSLDLYADLAIAPQPFQPQGAASLSTTAVDAENAEGTPASSGPNSEAALRGSAA